MKRPQLGGPAAKRKPERSNVVELRPKSAVKPRATDAKRGKSQPAKFSKSKRKQSPLDAISRGITNRLSSNLNNAIDARRRFSGYSRTRRVVSLSIVSALSALILLVLACVFTPIIAVQKITVTGLNRVDEKQVMAQLKSQIGLPLPQVNQQAIAESLSKFALIDSVAAIAQPPHTLQIAITERQPICVVNVVGVAYLYDPAGVRIDRARLSDKYPLISIVGDPKTSATFKEAIDVLLALPASLLPRVAEIDAKSKDDVTMRLRGYAGQRILWGDSSQAVLKSKVLSALIKNQKQTDRVTFDVSSPTAPIVRYQ